MVGDVRRHRRGLTATVFAREAGMSRTEVRDCSDQIHPLDDRGRAAGRSPGTATQNRQAAVGATMDADVAQPHLAPCQIVHVWAPCRLRIDGTPPSASKYRRVSPDPCFFQV